MPRAYIGSMLKRSRKKRPTDVNLLAAKIAAEATQSQSPLVSVEKNQAAVALGRLGGRKGGPARAASLSAKKRREIAKKAAKTRWTKRRGNKEEEIATY